jgi:hypothetical protein
MKAYIMMLVMSLTLAACGGGGDNPPTPVTTAPPNQSVSGVWDASSANTNINSGMMLTSASGQFFYETTVGSCLGLYEGTISIADTSITGTGAFIPTPSASVCSVGGEDDTFVGTYQSPTITLTSTGGGTSNTIDWNADGAYDTPSSLDLVAGTYTTGFGGGSVPIVINSSGHILAQTLVNGCTVSGSISVIDSSHNLYNVQSSFEGCSDTDVNGVVFSGLATISNSTLIIAESASIDDTETVDWITLTPSS